MNISLIVAMARDSVIGLNQQMPWHLPADLQHFRRLTVHKSVIMGRCTHESIGCVLPKRRNIVITRQNALNASNLEICHSLSEALRRVEGEAEVMVIGGQSLFTEAMPLANRMYITEMFIYIS